LAGTAPKSQIWHPPYQTIGDLVPNGNISGPLARLAEKIGLEATDRSRLVASYRLLRDVRNRDAHFYAANVRTEHFDLVERLFVPCLNILVQCIPQGGATLGQWLEEAPKFIASL
jgi:hypothetical protein